MEILEINNKTSTREEGKEVTLEAIVEFEQVEYDLKVTGSFYFDVEEDKGDYYTAPSCEVGNLEVYINSIDVKKGEEQEALFNTPFHNNDKQIKNWLETYCFG